MIQEYIILKNTDCYPGSNKWEEPHNVGNVIGAFILMKKEVVDDVGLFDEDFFFNVEDVDYCKRVHEAGFSVIYDPNYSIIHIGGSSQDYSWINNPHLHKNRVIYFRKNHGILQGFLSKIIIFVGLNLRKGLSKYSNIKKG